MLVKDIMTKKPVTVRSSDSLEKTVKLLSRKGISGCPVIDSKNRVVGIITQSDILRAIDAQGSILEKGSDALKTVLGFLKGSRVPLRKMLRVPVKNYMKTPVITITEGDDIANIVSILNKNDIQRVPVVRGKKLVGIVSRKDVMKFLKKR